MIIHDIQYSNTKETREDDAYPQRIGCKVSWAMPPQMGCGMFLAYEKDNSGNPKSGYLATSPIVAFEEYSDRFHITTQNSIYILRKTSLDEDIFEF